MPRDSTIVLMQFGDHDEDIMHKTLYKVFKKPECTYVKLSYRIYKCENPKKFESTKTQTGFIDFVTTTLGKDNLYP